MSLHCTWERVCICDDYTHTVEHTKTGERQELAMAGLLALWAEAFA